MRDKRGLRMAAGLCLALLAAAGCSREDSAGVPPRSYANDGYMPRTNAYADIPGPGVTGTFATDSRYMREALAQVYGVAGADIAFNGGEVYVTLELDPNLDVRRRPTVTSQAAMTLRFNFPRYAFNVTSLP